MQRPARLRSPRRPLGATPHDQRRPRTSLAVAAGEEGTDKTRTGMGKRVFVTGASGFMGKNLVDALARREEDIFYLLCRSETTERRLREELRWVGTEQLRFVQGDITQPECGIDHTTLPEVSRHIDTIWHLAA